MFNKNNYNNEKQNSSSDSSSIKFKMKKESYRIKIRRRLTLILGILIFIFIISTNIIILKKYDELISKIDKSKIDVNRRVFEYDKVANKVADSIVSISDETGKLVKNSYSSSNVTGIILNEEGYILTNYTSINEFKEIYVKLP
ncbi:S1C family serine protease [Clostridium chauvoei]|nr:S1C family serine protease [Clostridium chauvoei]MBX7335796.1 S1C family serine protease [Clostridium chauvoei]